MVPSRRIVLEKARNWAGQEEKCGRLWDTLPRGTSCNIARHILVGLCAMDTPSRSFPPPCASSPLSRWPPFSLFAASKALLVLGQIFAILIASYMTQAPSAKHSSEGSLSSASRNAMSPCISRSPQPGSRQCHHSMLDGAYHNSYLSQTSSDHPSNPL